MKSNTTLLKHLPVEIAELTGVILGDGHIHTKSNKITITGSLEDLQYYKEMIIPLFRMYFKGKIHLKRRKDKNSYYFWIEDKATLNLFLKIGLKRGHKKNAGIPKIIKYNNNLIVYFLRGLFDTDGCLKFSKQMRDYLYYPRIRLCFQDSPLIDDLKTILKILEFSYSILGPWVVISGSDFRITKSNFKLAFSMMPISEPEDFCDAIQGKYFVYAILNDLRIKS